MEKYLRTTAFFGMIIIDSVITVGILLPVSIVELAIDKELGTYEAMKQMCDFTVKIGTGDCG